MFTKLRLTSFMKVNLMWKIYALHIFIGVFRTSFAAKEGKFYAIVVLLKVYNTCFHNSAHSINRHKYEVNCKFNLYPIKTTLIWIANAHLLDHCRAYCI